MSRVLLQGAALLALLQGAACFAGKTAAPTKASKESGLQCLDHKDNDGDGKADCQDPDCMNDPTYGDVCFSFYGPCSLNGIRPNMLKVEDNCANTTTGAFQQYCTPACSKDFVPFFGNLKRKCMASNSASMAGHAMAANPLFASLYKSCQLTQSIIHNSNDHNKEKSATCGAADLYPFYVQCATYLNAAQAHAVPSGTEFCESTCFELTKHYAKCEGGAKSFFMKSLRQLSAYIKTCAAPVQNQCQTQVQRITRLCKSVSEGAKDKCHTPCVTAYTGTEHSCTQGSADLAPYQKLFDQCAEASTDTSCSAAQSSVLDEVMEACCDSQFADQNCSANAMPTFCSSECSSAFLPFYSSCGRKVWSKRKAKMIEMDSFAELCAASEGRAVVNETDPSTGTTTPAGFHPNPKDPCSKIPNCGNCSGVCGWCRYEVEDYKGNGFCSSTCETSTGECEGTIGYGEGDEETNEDNTICKSSCAGMVFLDGAHEGQPVCSHEECSDEQPYVSSFNFGCTDKKRLWGGENCCDTRSCAASQN